MNFNAEEINLIAAFDLDRGIRADTLEQMRDMRSLLDNVITKLEAMTDDGYVALELSAAEEALDE
ncbi:MAG: hypothetical protein IJ049_04605 [Oscillospiraceae bacterium]|nr:hypothetical protein [Oscillospiraceae bacterium]